MSVEVRGARRPGAAARRWVEAATAGRVPWAGLAMVAAGVAAVVIVRHRLGQMPDDFWKNRDDGVITLSHARNLIDHGFIGVSPSGERVEGYSAPLQMALFAAAYALSRCGYASFIAWQTTLFTFALGAAVFACLRASRAPLGLTLAAAVGAVAAMTISIPWLQWHGSGLENSITHAGYLGSLAVLGRLVKHPSPPARWAVPLVLAAQSRAESVAHVGTLVVLFTGTHLLVHRDMRSLRLAGAFAAGVVALFVARWWYFGDLVPNTAHAQDLTGSLNLRRLCDGQLGDDLPDAAFDVFRRNLGMLALLALPLLGVARLRPESGFIAAGASLLILLAIGQVLVLGRARLDAARTTTYLAAAVALLVALAVVATPVAWPARLAMLLVLALPQTQALLRVGTPARTCCPAADFEHLRRAFEQRGLDEHLPRPLVANVDLGALSFSKQFNVLDLGLLGSRVIATSRDDRLRGDYVFRIAQPDLIEAHAFWQQTADYVIDDARLGRDYEPWSPGTMPPYLDSWCPRGGKPCFWARRAVLAGSRHPERQLIDEVAAARSVEPFRRAIERCNLSTERDACLFVARTAYRFLPDFAGAARRELVALFDAVRDEPQRRFIAAWLRSGERGRFELDVHDYLAATAGRKP